MEKLSLEQTQAWFAKVCGLRIYLHMEVNPEAYIRNAYVNLVSAHIIGDGPYRIHLQWTEPQGIMTINDISEMYDDGGILVCTGYDSQTRIAQTLSVSLQPLSM